MECSTIVNGSHPYPTIGVGEQCNFDILYAGAYIASL